MSSCKQEEQIEKLQKIIIQPDRCYKDRVFRMLFKEKKALLELYNGLNKSSVYRYRGNDDYDTGKRSVFGE